MTPSITHDTCLTSGLTRNVLHDAHVESRLYSSMLLNVMFWKTCSKLRAAVNRDTRFPGSVEICMNKTSRPPSLLPLRSRETYVHIMSTETPQPHSYINFVQPWIFSLPFVWSTPSAKIPVKTTEVHNLLCPSRMARTLKLSTPLQTAFVTWYPPVLYCS